MSYTRDQVIALMTEAILMADLDQSRDSDEIVKEVLEKFDKHGDVDCTCTDKNECEKHRA